MGLLDFLGAPGSDQSQAMGLLAGGLLKGDFGGGLLAANQVFSPEAKLKQQYMRAQLENLTSEADQRKAQLALAQRRQAALPNLYQGGGMTGGQAVPQELGGMPMFSQPMGAAPMQASPASFNWRAALDGGFTPDEIQKLAALPNAGKPKVARTVKGMGPDGREFEYQVDDYGQKVGDPFAQYRAPISVNQGNRTTFADPYSLKPVGAFQTFQSPDSAASNAVAIRGQNMADTRAREANELGKVPSGYRQAANGGLEFIPGGPADPNAAKKAAPTEFQGKSATFGARAQEADKILNGIGGDYSALGLNTKASMGRIPLVGGGVEAAANTFMSENSQRVEQAQRDFVNATLRQESGASINKEEFDNARRQYFPQPGDTAAVIAQKARNRQLVISGFRENARPGGVDEVVGGAGGGAGRASPTVNINDPLGLRR